MPTTSCRVSGADSDSQTRMIYGIPPCKLNDFRVQTSNLTSANVFIVFVEHPQKCHKVSRLVDLQTTWPRQPGPTQQSFVNKWLVSFVNHTFEGWLSIDQLEDFHYTSLLDLVPSIKDTVHLSAQECQYYKVHLSKVHLFHSFTPTIPLIRDVSAIRRYSESCSPASGLHITLS
jgi:hypothetical protein